VTPEESAIPGLSDRAEVTDGERTRSLEGLYHLVGNVDEWVTYEETGLHLYAHAGGSHVAFGADGPGISSGVAMIPGPATGFRCAADGA
jgi:hypothetical protein